MKIHSFFISCVTFSQNVLHKNIVRAKSTIYKVLNAVIINVNLNKIQCIDVCYSHVKYKTVMCGLVAFLFKNQSNSS